MYRDAGYGANWQPARNNARRIDPYTRSCVILGSLFAIGFLLIVVVVLSLIPIYISHNSSTTNSIIQVSRLYIKSYTLQFTSPSDTFDPQTIFSESTNRLALQAALTAMIQKDPVIAGSVVEINPSSISSNRKRRETSSNQFSITLGLNITGSKLSTSVAILTQYQNHAMNLLAHRNRTTPSVRYQLSNATQIYWFNYQLPQIIYSNATFAYVELKSFSALLDTLMLVDKTQNQPSAQNLITSTPIIFG